ncbi:MAG TPA: phosphoribosylformylglycinamidine cyclo-ligase [Clostridiales bacterium]|jgi:phosphoribosylformylglycinamidine cyclo-ligase|nr:phosphoribosylformylglycinamidine cyclo-ligase [Clostridiales bacterium]
MDEKLTYKDAGVDTKEGEKAVQLMKEHVKKTFNANVLTGLGSFGSIFKLDLTGINEPILVAGTDGVGTKLKIAFMLDKHDTIGQDCVAMCVNDILCQGAKPLFFLDYIATGKVKAEKVADIVKGVSDGCIIGECALVGGETAEMPDFYADGEYDMAGFAVGVVDRSRIVDGSKIKKGDVLIGLPSSGLHSNGYSLVRKLFFEIMKLRVNDYVADFGRTVGNELIIPTKIYTKACNAVMTKETVNGIIHITGGGFFENIPRIIPEGLGVRINIGSWSILPIFEYIQRCGNIDRNEMFSTFNMGIGMIMVVNKERAESIMDILKEAGEEPCIIGEVVSGEGVCLC